MLAGGERLETQCCLIQLFKRNSIKKFFNNFYFYYGFIFVKKYFEKIKKVFLFCEKLFLKKFFLGKVFDAKFYGKSFFAEKIFAESCRKKFWKKKFPQRWPKKFLPGKSLAWGKFWAKGKNVFESRKLKRRNGLLFGRKRTNMRKTIGQTYREVRMLEKKPSPRGKKIRILRNESIKKRNEYPKNSRFTAKNGHF